MIPDWIIRNTTQPYGARLPKRKDNLFKSSSSGWTPFPGSGSVVNGKPVEGNLPNQDYEFWIGSPFPAANFATCRFCEKHTQGAEQRQKHWVDNKPNPCSGKIKAVASALRKDMKCVICDSRATKTPWGFPLCSVKCIVAFKFESTPIATRNFELAKDRLDLK